MLELFLILRNAGASTCGLKKICFSRIGYVEFVEKQGSEQWLGVVLVPTNLCCGDGSTIQGVE